MIFPTLLLTLVHYQETSLGPETPSRGQGSLSEFLRAAAAFLL